MQSNRDDALIVAASPSPGVRAVFSAMVSRMMRRKFHAVRLARESRAALVDLNAGEGPALVVMNHAAWWDPILAVVLWREFFSSRPPFGPIDAHELHRFRIFRKLGLFGVDPDNPDTLEAMRRYVLGLVTDAPRLVLLLTPQGTFADVRDVVVARPGAAAMASALRVDRAVAVAVEYGFWVDQKPEVFVRAISIETQSDGTIAWHRRINEAMRANQEALASLVRARDAAAFEPLAPAFAPKLSGTNPAYDLWLRLTGRRGGELGMARRDRKSK